jgi:hypothetical protein
MARRSTRARKGNVVELNFDGVESRTLVDPGEYDNAVVAEVTQEEGEKAPYLKWKFKLDGGDFDGASLYLNTSLSEQSLWNLKGLLEALGVDIPEGPHDLDLDEIVDLPIGLVVEHEKYEGKNQARVVDFFAPEVDSKKKGADKKGAKTSSRRGKAADDDESEKTTSRSRRGKAKDDEKPARGGSRRAKEPEKLNQDEVADMSQEELEDVIEKYKLDVDLKEHRTLRKMANAVIDALEGEDLLED